MFKIEFSTENDAFGEDRYDKIVEITRLLDKVIVELNSGVTEKMPIMDINGNKVGYWEFTE